MKDPVAGRHGAIELPTNAVLHRAFVGGFSSEENNANSVFEDTYGGYCASDLLLDGYNPKAAKAVERTRQQLTHDDRQWLHGLPYVLQAERFAMVHATLDASQRWGYVFDKLAADASLARQETDLHFFGHTHVPGAFIRDALVRGGTYTKIKIERGIQYFIKVDAIGQPRENNPKAAYVIYDTDQETVELRRVEYDNAAARRKFETQDYLISGVNDKGRGISHLAFTKALQVELQGPNVKRAAGGYQP